MLEELNRALNLQKVTAVIVNELYLRRSFYARWGKLQKPTNGGGYDSRQFLLGANVAELERRNVRMRIRLFA